MCFAVELDQLLQHDRAGRHVDAQRKRLGGEDNLDQAFVKELFHNVPERRQHARMVRRKTTDENAAPAQETENLQIFLRNVCNTVIDNLGDALLLIPVSELCARSTDLRQRAFAARAGEDENDRGQHVHGAEHADNIAALRRAELALPLIAPAIRASTALVLFVLVALPGPSVAVAELGTTARLQQVLIDLDRLRLEEWIEPVSHQHVLMQRNRAQIRDNNVRVPAHRGKPATELLGVGHRRRQTDDGHGLVEVQNNLFPHSAALAVSEVVNLIHHHMRELLQRRRVRVNHIAQHLGGHHHDVCVAVNRSVASEQAHAAFAVVLD